MTAEPVMISGARPDVIGAPGEFALEPVLAAHAHPREKALPGVPGGLEEFVRVLTRRGHFGSDLRRGRGSVPEAQFRLFPRCQVNVGAQQKGCVLAWRPPV